MRFIVAFLAFIALSPMPSAQAGEMPVVVELYTSQGCSSCPPADDILTELAKRDNVIALALHVDYWDYLGWKDEFANAAFSRRQRAYAAAGGRHTVYTPQMIVQGHSYAVGNQLTEVKRAVSMHGNDDGNVALTLNLSGGQLTITARALTQNVGSSVIQVVRYMPHKTVLIKAGENAGRKVVYSNVVTDWTPVLRWNGQGEVTTSTQISGDEPVVVLVQNEDFGPIVGAQRLFP